MPIFKKKLPSNKKIEVLNKSSNIKKISFKKDLSNQLIKLGSGSIGNVYLGHIYFEAGKKRQVAIKTFKFDVSKNIPIYKKILKDLNTIKLPKDPKYPNRPETTLFPKIGFVKVKLPNGSKEWVQISPAYIKENKSKLLSNNQFFEFNEKEMVWILSEVARKGYDSYDLVAQFKNKESLIPLDIDVLVETYKHKGLLKGDNRVTELLYSLAKVSGMGAFNGFGDIDTYNRLCDILIKIRPSIKNVVDKYRKIKFFEYHEDMLNDSF